MSTCRYMVAASVVLTTLAGIPARTDAQEPDRRTLTVVVCDSVGVLPDVLAAARDTASRVYRRIGVDIVWRDKVAQVTSPEPPNAGPGALTLYVRLVPLAWRPPALVATSAMGFTTVGGRVASVMVERVLALAASDRLVPAHLLGYVMAHELGHLLLGSRPHAVSGVMSESIDRRGCAEGLLGFAKDEGAAIRARLTLGNLPRPRY